MVLSHCVGDYCFIWIPACAGMTDSSITFNSYQWTVPSQITLPGGTVRNYSYDGLLRLKELNVKDPGQSQVMNYQYGYDLTGNITGKTTEAGATNYSYDTLDRLTGASYTNQAPAQTNETYSYDPLANRVTGSNASTGTAQVPTRYTYNENNQLLTAGSISYTYDDNGNTTNQTDSVNPANSRNYVYDTDNRLIEVRNGSTGSPQAGTLIAAYSYDPFGRRISKDVGNSKIYYLYNAEGLIAEADASGQITKSYGYAPGSTFTTNPLWMKATATGAQTQSYYTYQNDHLGTPMKLLNQSGVVVWSATYDAFGKATVDAGSTVANNHRYPGQYEDAETGLHYSWMRYYDPNTGRYPTSDPIGLRGGKNLYTYVRGNPISSIDPFGLCTCEAIESTAKSNLGSEKWNRPEVANTCNEGVYDNLKQADANAPNRYPNWMGNYPLGAGAGGWGDSETKIDGWAVTTTPQPGDVAAGDGGTGSPHVGIVIRRSNGTLGTAGVSSSDGKWKETGWPFRKKDKPATFWRCTCK